jgi:hypothetical protein
MGFSIARLLVHNDAVPRAAREAIARANIGSREEQKRALETAARVLFRETELDCRDARELVGLDAAPCHP